MLKRAGLSLLAGLVVLLSTAPAEAAWRGTPGKVAYIDRDSAEMPLRVWTPELGGEAGAFIQDTFHFPLDDNDTTPMTAGFPSAPAWSPDGTRLAFAAKVL